MSAEISPTAPESLTPALASIVPLAHHEEFHNSTTKEQRQRIAALLQIFDEIASSPAGVRPTACRIALERPGFLSAGSLLSLYYSYKKTRDWRVLICKWRNGKAGLPSEFVEHFRKRTEQNHRDTSARAVMGQIKDEWARGESIPGYGTWREFFATQFPERDLPERWPYGFFPEGWSKSNLYTKQSKKAERALARRGWAAAKRYLPHVVRDTSGLRFMELIVIDDFETDIVVQARNPLTGRYEMVTCTGLLAMDVATRTTLAFALKPRFRDEESRRVAITRADVQFLLHSVFSTHGLPGDWGCTILCENASAAISDDVADMLESLFGVQVGRTGMLADKVLANGFVPKGGKPWEKGWIESSFNIMGNHAGAFPGHKGAMYTLKPDDHEARLLYAENLLKTEGLAPEVVDQLKTGFWKLDQAIEGYSRILGYMERRTDHRMQGFDEVCDYELPGEPGLITETQAQALPREQLLRLVPTPRRESPIERKVRLTANMRRVQLAEHALALLLLTPKRCKVENLRVTFTHLGEGFTFAEAGSPIMDLAEGTELLGYFDPARPDKLFCCRQNGRYIGTVRRRGAVDIRACEALAAERGEITDIITQHVVANVQRRHADTDQALAAMKAENEAILARTGDVAPDPDTGKQRRASISAQLASAAPIQPRHAAAATGLAVAVATDARAQTRSTDRATALQQADDLDAQNLF